MIYNDKIRNLRMEKELTQKELASTLSLSRDLYNHYETEYMIIPVKHLNSLCNFFDVSFDYIFDFTDDKKYLGTSKDIDKKMSGTRLKEFRKENKITQDKLAKILNVSRTTITEYERGTNIIATPILYDLCTKYGISADYLLGKIDEPKYLKTSR